MSSPRKRGATVYFPEFDNSHNITVTLAIELPFWIPIKSGEYKVPKGHTIKIRNDLWLVTTANLVDGPLNQPFEFIVNETQVTDREYLERITGGSTRYFHKKKLKTTITRRLVLIPPVGEITETPGSEDWEEQLHNIVFEAFNPRASQSILDEINRFIDHYCSIISINNPAREVRRVNFYETMIRVVISAKNQEVQYTYPTKITHDINMADLPFPSFRVRSEDELDMFRGTLDTLYKPAFHQLLWVKTLNHNREKRYQDALLSATLTLEALAYRYLDSVGISKDKIKKSKGMANWVNSLAPQVSKYTCQNVANLWRLRNEVVHEQKILSKNEIQIIQEGIRSLTKLRNHFLQSINPDLLKVENRFTSFLEPIQLGETVSDAINEIVLLRYEWRREQDCYQTTVTPSHSEENVECENDNKIPDSN